MQWETATPVGFPVCMRHNDCSLCLGHAFLDGCTIGLFMGDMSNLDAFSGSPHGGQNQKWLHHPCILGDGLFDEVGQKQARLGDEKKKMHGAPILPLYCCH